MQDGILNTPAFLREWERTLRGLKDITPGVVGLQLPEGLVRRSGKLAEDIQVNTGADVMVLADPCYGACGIGGVDPELLKLDALVHVGHLPMGIPNAGAVPVFYVPIKQDVDRSLLEGLLKSWDAPHRLGLVSVTQYINWLPVARDILSKMGVDVFMGDGGPRLAAPGQVLGCDFSVPRSVAGSVDAFLFVGTGVFHPLGVSLSTGKPVFRADVELGRLLPPDHDEMVDRWRRKRHAALERIRGSERIGVVVSTHPGQARFALARKTCNMLKKAGYNTTLMVARELGPTFTDRMGMNGYVICACPRIVVDDQSSHSRPIITPLEARILTGDIPWEDHGPDEIVAEDLGDWSVEDEGT